MNQVVVAQLNFLAKKDFTRFHVMPRRVFNRFDLLIILIGKLLERNGKSRLFVLG